jgi:hypothetical protein
MVVTIDNWLDLAVDGFDGFLSSWHTIRRNQFIRDLGIYKLILSNLET